MPAPAEPTACPGEHATAQPSPGPGADVSQLTATLTSRAHLLDPVAQGALDHARVTSDLRDQLPGLFDFSWQEDHGVVVATDDAREQISALFHDQPVRVNAAAEDVIPYTLRSEAEMIVLARLKDQPLTASGAAYDPTSNTVKVTVWPAPGRSKPANLAALVGEEIEVHGRELAVSVDYKFGDPPVEESTTQGGEAYTNGCTGGFVGYRDGVYGIITAAHCTIKPSKYDGDTTQSTYSASNRNRDLRFTALSDGTPQNKTRTGSSTYTHITNIGNLSPGIKVGKYGQRTGYDSDRIDTYEGCQKFTSGKTWCGLYRTKNHITAAGDSGGPWFHANRAYGVTTGGSSAGSYVSSITDIKHISGSVSVKTR